MDDITLVAKLDNDTTIYVSPIHEKTYAEFVEYDNLGGSGGYFISRERHGQYEVLAKAANLDAAREIFWMMTKARARPMTAAGAAKVLLDEPDVINGLSRFFSANKLDGTDAFHHASAMRALSEWAGE